jgi:uroporphyrinogen-III decarboxylase
MSGSEMMPRERLLAAFRRQPCDCVPFTPLLEGYFQASLGEDDPLRSMSIEDLQWELTGQVLIRAHPLKLNTPAWIGAFWPENPPPEVQQRIYEEDGAIIHLTETPVGQLRWKLQYRPESPYIPWVLENRIRTVEDVKTFQYVLEHTNFELAPEYFSQMTTKVGERGLICVLGPTSPLQQMINFDVGLEHLVYLLADYPDEMNEMLEVCHDLHLRMWSTMAELPAEVYFIHDNLSSTTTSRPMYRRYDRRFANAYQAALGPEKKLMTHWCGRLTAFADDFAEARHAGMSDVTPLPTGDMDIVGARKSWAKQFIVMGGIDPTLFARGTADDLDSYVESLLTRMEPDRRGFILGSGDAVPFGTPPDNVRAAATAATRFRVD